MEANMVSVVIPTRNEGTYLPYTVHWIMKNSAHPRFEIIVVDDGSTDDSVQQVVNYYGSTGKVRIVQGEQQGPGQARNLGAHEARGEIVVFIDAHCYTPPGWLLGITLPLADPEKALVGCAFADLRQPAKGLGVGCTWSDATLDLVWLEQKSNDVYPVPLLPGGCQAMRKDDFQSFGQYDQGMNHIGSEGEEQSLRCWLMGYSVVVQPSVVVHHLFRDQPPYEVRAGELIYNRLRTALVHFAPERVERVFEALKWSTHFSEQIMALLQSDVMERRLKFQEQRTHCDDWFFRQFGIPI